MCDVLDENGNIVFYGLGSCYSYYDNSLNQLPEHVFVAKRGFTTLDGHERQMALLPKHLLFHQRRR